MRRPTKPTGGHPERYKPKGWHRKTPQRDSLSTDDLLDQMQKISLGTNITPSLLLRLPLEIREDVYFYAIVAHLDWLKEHEPETINPTGLTGVKNELQLYPPLLRADDVYLAEAEPILLSDFTFYFTDPSLLREIPAENRNLVKHIGIKVSSGRYGYSELVHPPAD